MRGIEIINLFGAILVIGGPMSARAEVQAENSATNLPPLLAAAVRSEGGPGLITANYAYITAGSNRFGFVMMPGFRLESSDREISLIKVDFSCLIKFRVMGPRLAENAELTAEAGRELLLGERPGATILEEFSSSTIGRRGPTFELLWRDAGALVRRGRILYIPADAGVLEFSVFSSVANWEESRQVFNRFLLTFRTSDGKGELHLPRLSNKF